MPPSPVISSITESIPEFQQYQHQFVDYLRNPLRHKVLPESLPQRSNIYAKLLYSKIEGSLDTCFPISCQLLGATRWKQLIQTFIRDHRCKSPLYREIPDEFVDYLMNEQTQLKLPGFIVELAHYEWMELVLETEKPSNSTEFFPVQGELLTVIPALNPVLHLLHYHYPVQNITASDPYWKNWDTRIEPYPQEVIILAGLRDNDDKVHFIQLNAVTTRLIELIQEGFSTGEQALLELADEMHYGNHESILPFGIQTLQQLKEQHIIIGAQNEY
jgi:hypothetical protein